MDLPELNLKEKVGNFSEIMNRVVNGGEFSDSIDGKSKDVLHGLLALLHDDSPNESVLKGLLYQIILPA